MRQKKNIILQKKNSILQSGWKDFMSPISWHFEKKDPIVEFSQILLHFVYTPNPFPLICLIALIELISNIMTVSSTMQTLNSLLIENC